jgi:hypothetical protein
MDLHSSVPGLSGSVSLPPVEEVDDFKSFVPAERGGPVSAVATRSRPVSSGAVAHTERVNATFVVALTLACSALALFDLFLLASGW